METRLIINKDNEKFKMYSFISNAGENTLEAFHIHGKINCISVEAIENLDKCLGVLCINEPQALSNNFYKVKIAVILSNEIIALEFFCPTTDD
uniref:Uncharacterized protein n=1 Tax=Strongyloides papillosus TaxID=174720 RepID=A0A0N5BSI1_STREA